MDEEWCYKVLRCCRWPTGVTCAWCGGRKVTVHTRRGRTPRLRYLCLHCRRTFTDLSGTIFTRSNLPLSKWFDCLLLLRYGRSTTDLARFLGVKWDTAAHMGRRLGVALARPGLIWQLSEAMEKGERG